VARLPPFTESVLGSFGPLLDLVVLLGVLNPYGGEGPSAMSSKYFDFPKTPLASHCARVECHRKRPAPPCAPEDLDFAPDMGRTVLDYLTPALRDPSHRLPPLPMSVVMRHAVALPSMCAGDRYDLCLDKLESVIWRMPPLRGNLIVVVHGGPASCARSFRVDGFLACGKPHAPGCDYMACLPGGFKACTYVTQQERCAIRYPSH
jgi:hypothetical protein